MSTPQNSQGWITKQRHFIPHLQPMYHKMKQYYLIWGHSASPRLLHILALEKSLKTFLAAYAKEF